MKRKTAAILMTLAMSVTAIAGCGSDNTPKTSQVSGEQSSGENSVVAEMGTGAADTNDTAEDWSEFVKDGKTVIRVGIEADPGTLDPFTTGSSNGKNATIKSCVYQYLGMIQGVGGELAPEIAKGWTQIDAVSYDIDLFDYVKDSEGNAITAEDVVFSYDKFIEAGSNNARFIESMEKTGDFSVRLTIKIPAVTLFERIMQSVPIVNKAAYEADPDNMSTNLIATGPYVVKEWISGSYLVLEKNENYWQTPELAAKDINQAANVDRIEFSVIKEASQLAIALETGNIDMVYNLSATEASRFMEGGESVEGFNMFTAVNNLTQTMFLNANEASILGNDLALRQAVLYAFDSQGFVDGASDGYGVTCKTFGSDLLPDFQEKWRSEDYYEYNPEKAKELLKESNYKGENLRIVTNGTPMRDKIAQILQAYLLQVGINSEILSYDDTLFNTYKNDATQFDILLDNCGTSDTLMGMWRGKMANNCCTYGTANMAMDDELQALLDVAQHPDTNNEESVDALHQYIKENAYVVGMYNNLSFTICRNVVSDVAMNSTPWLLPSGCTYVWNE